MNIFIDAYNLLKQLHGVTQVSAYQKDSFKHQLKKFAESKDHHIYLIYDGGDSVHLQSEQYGPIKIIYSGYKLTADDVIKQKITQHAHEHTILVSDDRQLCDHVAAQGFAALGTSNFYKLMQSDNRKKDVARMKQGLAQKSPGYSSSPELDELMRQASCIGYYKDEQSVPEQSYTQELSKKEKKLKKLVKKL